MEASKRNKQITPLASIFVFVAKDKILNHITIGFKLLA